MKKLFLTGYTGYPPRKEIDKTALGAVDSVNWEHFENTLEAVHQIKKNNIQLLALEHTTESIPYDKYEYKFPFCLLLGNEVEGITNELVLEADASIEIPMFGLKQSLNVSVAFGIVMYHALGKMLETRLS